MVKIEAFPNIIKNYGTDFFYFLHEDRSNPFLTHSENRMSGKNLVCEIFGTESGAGQVSGPSGLLFKSKDLGNEKDKPKSDWIFRLYFIAKTYEEWDG